MEALVRFSLSEGLIITENDEYVEEVERNGQSFTIRVVQIWKWLAFSAWEDFLYKTPLLTDDFSVERQQKLPQKRDD